MPYRMRCVAEITIEKFYHQKKKADYRMYDGDFLFIPIDRPANAHTIGKKIIIEYDIGFIETESKNGYGIQNN